MQSTPSGQTAELLTVGPTLEPELVEVRTFPADLRTVARPGANGAGFRQTAWDDQPTVSKAGQVQMLNHTAVGDSPTSSFGHERPGGAFAQLLDQVFGPDRFAGNPPMGKLDAVHSPEPNHTDGTGHGLAQAWRGDFVAGGQGVATAVGTLNTEVEKREVRRRQETEKAYHDEFSALAKIDVQELERRADVVLRGSGENCQQVAMLRVLYEVDQQRALGYFSQAISTLPDRSRPEGISVPAFAVDYLSRRVASPTVKVMVEQIAWMGYLNVSPDMRRKAAEALLATANSADMQRYVTLPGYQEYTVTKSTVTESEMRR